MARKKTVSDEELYKLKEQRMTYKEISQYLAERGIKISERQVGRRISKIYEDMNEEVTRGSRISDEELYRLKERGLIYRQMVEYFAGIGIEISERAIIKRVKKIYADRKKKIPKGRPISDKELHELIEERKNCQKKKIEKPESKQKIKKTKKKRPKDRQLYRLKKKGLSYKEIVEYLAKEKGITICWCTVAIRTKRIFDAKGEEVPRAKGTSSKELGKKRKNRSRGRIQVSDQELYKLKQKCMSYSAISKYLERKGIKLCPSSIGRRIREIYSEKGGKIPRGRKGRIYTSPELIEAIWNLKNTRNASDEQINRIAELYGVNLNRNVIKRTCDKFKRHRYW